VGARTVSDRTQKFGLVFAAHVLSQMQQKQPLQGRIGGNEKSHKVKFDGSDKSLLLFLEPLQEWVAEKQEEPPIILNKHCPTYHRDLCRNQAKRENNLSLLAGVTSKMIRNYEKKGLFTVKQLSYTFKPRKRKKRTKNPSTVTYKPKLRTLAIREQKTYLQEVPDLTRQPIELFLDIEAIPDQDFTYLISLLVSENETTTYYPFWADSKTDEFQIWQQFLEKANA